MQTIENIEFPLLHDDRYPVQRKALQLEPYLRAIVNSVRPERIILFGSYAYGTPTEDSDFDLLVIRRAIESSKQSNMQIRFAIQDVNAPPASFTFLSQTAQGFEEKINSGSFVYREIAERGLEIYAAEKDK